MGQIIAGGSLPTLPAEGTNLSELCTLFDLPIAPDEIGVILPPANLRRIEFSALDFTTARRAIIEYIRTYFPNDFNDFVASNGVMMITEVVANQVDKLSLREDILANEAFLPTSLTEEAVSNHLALINQRIQRQTPAIVDIQVTVQTPLSTDVRIAAGLVFEISGPDGDPVLYELFKAPGDFESDIVIPAGKRGLIATGIEGSFASPLTISSPGGSNQQFIVPEGDILDQPIFVELDTGSEIQEWTATTEPLERFGPNDHVVNVQLFSDTGIFTFGNDINGQSPLPGQTITIRYRTGGGIRGRIGVGVISDARQVTPLPPASAPVDVVFENISPSNGGTDRETLERAKRRAPRDFAVRAFASDRPASIVTAEDYAQIASTFRHPVFGAVAKGVTSIRTSPNVNLVEVYVLVEGPENTLVTPNVGLKQGLKTFLEEFNVLTDSVEVLDGVLKPIDIDATVVVSRNADASVVKTKVEAALDTFMDPTSRDMGQPLFVADLYETIMTVDGVAYVDIFEPADNILRTNNLANPTAGGVGINEIIIEGQRQVRYFYDKGGRRILAI
jgi:phage-related baseplate assembly protein